MGALVIHRHMHEGVEIACACCGKKAQVTIARIDRHRVGLALSGPEDMRFTKLESADDDEPQRGADVSVIPMFVRRADLQQRRRA